jgi:hypothetical protein
MSAQTQSAAKPVSFGTLWNMNFGFLGIQFGWALQMANMSAIYEYMGASCGWPRRSRDSSCSRSSGT